MTAVLPDKYGTTEYQEAHRSIFKHPARHDIPRSLPPGLSEGDFAQAILDFVSVVGKDAVFVDQGLSDYIDPYDIWEADEGKRKTPSGAVW